MFYFLPQVRSVVGGVDYKGVREIMKNCIEKAQSLPTHLHLAIRPQAEALSSVLAYIFDRNVFYRKYPLHSAALPTYLLDVCLCLMLAGCKKIFHSFSFENVRNAALLPGYFIVNEILKSYPVGRIFSKIHYCLLK